ncbi:MAG: nickel pincer cofactor biosynthesis protein LarC [Lachnospiraceae bacterium]|nr:nickel pincer cofactor biosynthesis protein LarC [Lachnospiraceae bacterium]
MNQLYLECLSGISGDMFVAALLDLGADEAVLQKVLDTVPVHGFHTRISRVKKAGLDVCDFDVILDEHHENHDHDMEYLFGKQSRSESTGTRTHSHTEGQDHAHENHEHPHENQDHEHHHEEKHSHEINEHHHEEEHSHEINEHHREEKHTHEVNGHHHEEEHTHGNHENHHHEHRGMKEVLDIIRETQMSEHARELAIRIFTILGQAEAKAHGTTLEEVHFHEVGTVDSIVDIIAAAVCLDNLQIHDVIIPVLYEGIGKIHCQHGILPIPVPAVANIISANHLALHVTDMEAELVTPTGAAIAAAIQTKARLPESYTIQRIGIGAGKRNYESPSLLRAMFIEEQRQDTSEKGADHRSDRDIIYKLESNIDDCTGENLGYVMERLLEAGARDVNYMPVFMKKNRPAYQLNVICREEDVSKLEHLIFTETTTIGIRKIAMERSILNREIREITTAYGTAKVKVCSWNEDGQQKIKIYPEYDSVTELCRKTGKAFSEIFLIIERKAWDELGE